MRTKHSLVLIMSVEMLVRRKDKINKQSEKLDAMCTKRGDVIVVKESPCVWSVPEYENPDWIIIAVNITIGDAEAFLQLEEPIAAREAQPLLKKRMMKLDLDKLTLKIKDSDKAKDVSPWKEKFNHDAIDIIDNRVIKVPAPTVLA